MQTILDQAELSGARVSAWDEIQNLFTAAGLGRVAQVVSDFVGIHESNRSKLGVGGSEAHHYSADILKIGFSWKRASDASAFECPPQPYDQEAVRVNQSSVQPSAYKGLISIVSSSGNTLRSSVACSVETSSYKCWICILACCSNQDSQRGGKVNSSSGYGGRCIMFCVVDASSIGVG